MVRLKTKCLLITYFCIGVFTLIEKGICDRQNISSFHVFVFICTFVWQSLHFLMNFPFLFLFIELYKYIGIYARVFFYISTFSSVCTCIYVITFSLQYWKLFELNQTSRVYLLFDAYYFRNKREYLTKELYEVNLKYEVIFYIICNEPKIKSNFK